MGIFNDLFNFNRNKESKERALAEKQDESGFETKKIIRDKIILSQKFFEKQIEKTENYIITIKSDYKRKIKEDANFDFSGYFDDFNIEFLHLTGAKFSKGEKVVNILPDCTFLMETAGKNWETGIDYSIENKDLIGLRDSISIGILANVERKHFEQLALVMKEKGFSDFLIDYLVTSQVPDYKAGQELIVKDNISINFLTDIIGTEDKAEAEKKIKEYLDKYYYTKQNLDYYYNAHEFEGGRNYYGYWCWEAAAIIKIKNLSDNSFRNNKYYPYDFVHWDS